MKNKGLHSKPMYKTFGVINVTRKRETGKNFENDVLADPQDDAFILNKLNFGEWKHHFVDRPKRDFRNFFPVSRFRVTLMAPNVLNVGFEWSPLFFMLTPFHEN
ncbi:hypothetical protein B9Z55_022293 [Caenorhabditis nigoni]|uniref:Uncharacterized protein n=1 Tax=Caenorhabditis nigoni TaxID=1611254 RepID=A0A2G5SJL8_9PELO|nr:hypothetical protein B9Z55_022293 [Caenorhabditis nigoni]